MIELVISATNGGNGIHRLEVGICPNVAENIVELRPLDRDFFTFQLQAL